MPKPSKKSRRTAIPYAKTALMILVLISASTSSSAMSAGRPLSQLMKESAAVAVLTFEDATQVGDEFYLSTVVLRVPVGADQLLRTGPLQVSAAAAGPMEIESAPSKRQPQLCFLRSSPEGWVINPRIQNGHGINELCFPALSSTELEDTGQSLGIPVTGDVLTEAALGFALRGPSSGSDFGQIAEALELGDHDELVDALETSPYPYGKGLAVAIQLKNSDPEALPKLLDDGWAALPMSFRVDVASPLCTSYRSPSPAGLAVLGRLTAVQEPIYIRRCAAMALRAIHVQAALPYLAALLDSDQTELRLLGAWGLSDFVHSGRIPSEPELRERGSKIDRTSHAMSNAETLENSVPSRDAFVQNEQRYLSYWHNWWLTNKGQLYQNAAESTEGR